MTNTTNTQTQETTTFSVENLLYSALNRVANHQTNLEVHTSISGNEFKGMNLQILDLEGKTKNYKTNTWATEQQMNENNLVFNGEKQYPTILFSKSKNGKVTYYKVWNLDQLMEKAA